MRDINEIKSEIKNNISSLIEKGNIDSARSLMNEYENIVSNDIDIYSTKAVIAMIERNFQEAESILKEGLKTDSSNFDILYNLGYLYEILEKYNEAFRYYKRALKITKNQKEQKELNDILNNILDNHKNELELYQYTDRKKVLIIAHIFPPVGGSGVQRTLKFVKYLRDFGWEPIVVTVGKTMYPLSDESLVKEIPKGIKIIRIDEPNTIDKQLIKDLVKIITNVIDDKKLVSAYIKELNKYKSDIEQLVKLVLLPGPYIIWAKEVLDKINSEVDFEEIDLIYSTSGPYSDHIIGYYLKQKYSKPWVADFRDEWTNNPYADYDKKSTRYKIEFAMENKIVQSADKLITISSIAADNYRKIFKLHKDKVIEITNGYDENDFKDITEQKGNNEKFTVIHNGLFYGIRTPLTFLQAISNLVKKKLVSKQHLRICFRKNKEDIDWKEFAKKYGVDDCIDLLGYSNHKKSLNEAINADLLLLVVGPGEKNKGVYTGKIFEYLRLNKPILSLAPKGGVLDKLISETNRGYNVDYYDIDRIEKYLLRLYKAWEKGKQYTFSVDEKVRKYERKELTKKLCNVFNNILEEKLELSCKDNNIELLKSKIKSLINKRDLNTAKIFIKKLEKELPLDIDVYSLKALVLIKEKEFDKAEKILRDGLNIMSNNVNLLYNLAYVYEKKQQYLKAIELYEKVVFLLGENNKDSENIINYINELEQKYKEIIEKQLYEQRQQKIILGNKKLYLHLMYDSQYCDKFIHFINKHFDNNEHLFIVISLKDQPLKYLNVDKVENVKIIDLRYDLQELVKHIESSSKIFVHFLSSQFCQIIYRLCNNKETYWILWGGDLYYHIDWNIYDDLTEELLEKLGYDTKQQNNKNTLQYLYRKAAIRMIDYILTWNEHDYNIVKEHFITSAQQLCFYYSNPIDYKSLSQVTQSQLKDEYNFKKQFEYVVLVGNSADPSNNHLEIFNKLEKLDKNDFCILSPLSYGTNSLYTQEIIKEGKKRFGNRFIPILDYLSPEDYYSVLKQVDVAIFNHNRQQAVGNIWALIYLEKKIYIKRETTTYKWCNKLGIKLECLENLCGNFHSFFDINPNILDKNKIILEKTVNCLNNLENLKNIFYGSA